MRNRRPQILDDPGGIHSKRLTLVAVCHQSVTWLCMVGPTAGLLRNAKIAKFRVPIDVGSDVR
jgi:hypothetical protein